jgi:xanthine/CO dehydrogenase XdhC/CoxF family maturation factor
VNRREVESFLAAIRQARAAGERAAVATIVRVKGSAYRREGTRMLVRSDGTYECALSGGCLEPSVAEAAVRVIDTGEPVVVNYELADDSLWGLGMGCSGAVDVRIERLADLEVDETLRAWLAVLEREEAAALITPLSGASGRLLVYANGEHLGHLSDTTIEHEAITRARIRLGAVLTSGAERVGTGEVFFEMSAPATELVVFGAGLDAVPLAQEAEALGFSVTVVDVRAAYLTRERFPTARLIAAHFSQFATAIPLAAGSFVLVMNHHLERDEESLRYALGSGAAYIGVLGPRSRYQKQIADLAATGFIATASSLARVHSPVGLAIGAETPAEVAVAILAEMLAISRGFEGGFLNGSSESLHTPADRRLLASS